MDSTNKKHSRFKLYVRMIKSILKSFRNPEILYTRQTISEGIVYVSFRIKIDRSEYLDWFKNNRKDK